MRTGYLRLGRDVACVEIRILRHVEVRRVALLDGGADGIRELRVGPIPRAMISSERALERVWLRYRIAALGKLCGVPGGKRDVRARCNYAGGHRPWIGRDLLVPRESDCRQGALLVLRGRRPGSLAARRISPPGRTHRRWSNSVRPASPRA